MSTTPPRAPSTPSIDEEEEELFTQELARLKATNGIAEPLWVEKFGAALPAAQPFLRARALQVERQIQDDENAVKEDGFDEENDARGQRSAIEEDPLLQDVRHRQAKFGQAMSRK